MQAFQTKFDRWTRRHDDLVYRGLELGATEVIKTSQKNYLTGPRPEILGVRTGRLRRSINKRMSRNPVRASVGTNVPYGRVWELGRKKKGGGKDKRPFIRPSIADNKDRIGELIANQLVAGYGK